MAPLPAACRVVRQLGGLALWLVVLPQPHRPAQLHTFSGGASSGPTTKALGTRCRWHLALLHQLGRIELRQLTLAQALIAADLSAHAAEADQLLGQVLQLVPRGEIAEKARRASRRIADHNLRRSQGDGLRSAVVDGLLHAMRIYEALSPAQRQAVLVEVAAIGEKGLPVNQPGVSYSLKTLSGTFTALELACLIDVGGRLVLGMEQGGFEFEAEYQEALRSQQAGQP